MKKALCVLLSVVMLLSMSVTAFAADTKGAPSQTLPSWLPDDAPAPAFGITYRPKLSIFLIIPVDFTKTPPHTSNICKSL